MTNLPLALNSPAVLRPIFWNILLACIAGVLLVSTMARAELPVVVPETTAAALARMRDGNIRWAAFQLLALAILWLAILPFFNMFSRHIELEADRFGLELTHQNPPAAKIFVRDAQTSLAPD